MLNAARGGSISVDPPQRQQQTLQPDDIRGKTPEEVCQIANKMIQDARRHHVTRLLNGEALQPAHAELVRIGVQSHEVHGLLTNRIRWPSDLDKDAVRGGLAGELRCVEIDVNGLGIANREGGHALGNDLLSMVAEYGRVCIEDSRGIYCDARHPLGVRYLVHVSGDELRMLTRGSMQMVMAVLATANAALETQLVSPDLPGVSRSISFAQSSLFEASVVWRELTHVYPSLQATSLDELITRLIQMQKMIADQRMLWLKDRDRIERAVTILEDNVVSWGKVAGLWLAKVDVNIDQIAELARLERPRRSAHILEMITEQHLQRLAKTKERIRQAPSSGRRPRLARLQVYSDDGPLISTSRDECDPRMMFYAGMGGLLQEPFTKERMVIKA